MAHRSETLSGVTPDPLRPSCCKVRQIFQSAQGNCMLCFILSWTCQIGAACCRFFFFLKPRDSHTLINLINFEAYHPSSCHFSFNVFLFQSVYYHSARGPTELSQDVSIWLWKYFEFNHVIISYVIHSEKKFLTYPLYGTKWFHKTVLVLEPY